MAVFSVTMKRSRVGEGKGGGWSRNVQLIIQTIPVVVDTYLRTSFTASQCLQKKFKLPWIALKFLSYMVPAFFSRLLSLAPLFPISSLPVVRGHPPPPVSCFYVFTRYAQNASPDYSLLGPFVQLCSCSQQATLKESFSQDKEQVCLGLLQRGNPFQPP